MARQLWRCDDAGILVEFLQRQLRMGPDVIGKLCKNIPAAFDIVDGRLLVICHDNLLK